MPTIKEIVRAYLQEYKYEGLWREFPDACGCELDDFMPCDGEGWNMAGCMPGHKVPCDCGEKCGYQHIGPGESLVANAGQAHKGGGGE